MCRDNPRLAGPAPLPACGRGCPLPADAVLVDEASMLSLPLAAALFDALRPKCQLVLVGDVDQLPPVGERGRQPFCSKARGSEGAAWASQELGTAAWLGPVGEAPR